MSSKATLDHPSLKRPIEVEIRECGVDWAEDFLKHNKSNRNVSQENLQRMTRDHEAGHFDFNGEPILYDWNGDGRNGQHRALMILNTKKPATLFIVRNVPPESHETLDSGKKRTIKDKLTIFGVGDQNVGTVVGLGWRWDEGAYNTSTPRSEAPTMREAIAYYKVFEADILRAVQLGHHFTKKADVPFPVSLVAAFMVQARKKGWEWEPLERFCEQIALGIGLTEDDPVHAYRRWLTQSRKDATQQQVLAVTVKAFNYWLDGRPVKKIGWAGVGQKKEPFPEINSVENQEQA